MAVATRVSVLRGKFPRSGCGAAQRGELKPRSSAPSVRWRFVVGAGLVVVEVLILFWGVTTRYVLDAPSLWTDETAIILFIWLTMIGAVLGFQAQRAHADDDGGADASEHLATVGQRVRANGHRHILAATTYYAVIFTIHQYICPLRNFEIPDSWRASALRYRSR